MAESVRDQKPERYFWERFSPDIQASMGRYRARKGEVPIYIWDEYFLPDAKKTNAEIDFFQTYEVYRRERIGGGEYLTMVTEIADAAVEKIRKLERIPDVIVLIPTRKEVSTAHAVEVIQADLASATNKDSTPFFLVYHNDVEDPGGNVWHDLGSIRQNPRALVFDRKVSADYTIGEVRATLADVAFEIAYRLGREIPLLSSDADIMGVKGGTYPSMLASYRAHPDAWFVSSAWEFDPRSIENDVTEVLKARVSSRFNRLLESFISFEKWDFPPQINGTCFLASPRRLVALGGIPRVSLGEDILLGYSTGHPSTGKRRVIPFSEGTVYISGDRMVRDRRFLSAQGVESGGARYKDWERLARQPRLAVETHDLDVEEAVVSVNGFIRYAMHSAPRQLVDAGCDMEAIIRFASEIRSSLLEICEEYDLPIGSEDHEVHVDILKEIPASIRDYMTNRKI